MVQEALRENFGVVAGMGQVRRLSAETRALAARAIAGEFGRQMKAADFALSRAEAQSLSPNMRYAKVVRLIAEKAPLRIVEGEKLVGSATLIEATRHVTPVTDKWCEADEKFSKAQEIRSTSHTTIGFEAVLNTGYSALRGTLEQRLAREDLSAEGRELLQAMQICLEAAGRWHERYAELLKERIAESKGEVRKGYEDILQAMVDVPEQRPRNFRQAVQSLWLMWSFQRLCGNWSGVGRIDKMLGPYLAKDLSEGTISLDEARELLAQFWIKGCEWIGSSDQPGSGDAQFYQNIILSGVDADGRDVTNEVTYLVLDIVEELHISDFPIGVRVNSQAPEKLWRRIAEVQRLGGGIVSIYNEELVLRALVRFGYPIEEAREFTNDGCWEVIIPGKTAFLYYPFDVLQVFQKALGEVSDASCPDFEGLYQSFIRCLETAIDEFNQVADCVFLKGMPAPLLSLFVEDCIEKARGYHDRGAKYTVFAPHAGGLPDVVNSLYVLKKVVYDERMMGLSEFVDILRSDWQEKGELRRKIQNRYELYGNDCEEVDKLAVRVFDDYVRMVEKVKGRKGVLRPAGISTFGREIVWRKDRQATPFGGHQGDILATNLAPTPGSDKYGPTAVIKSYCAMDFERLPNGVPLELKILPASLKGERGLQTLVAILKTFVTLGGWYLQIDVVDSEVLRDAQKNPEKYPNLSVRISGWSARFATLSKEWQDMIIQRTQQKM
jgi:formate C-acetyltransferase